MIHVSLAGTGAPVPAVPVAPLEPAELLVLPFTISIDHRERQAGWRFQGLLGSASEKYRPLVIPLREVCLKTADYAIEESKVFVERKSGEDILGSITHGHERFRAEHVRMQEIVAAGGKCFVVIEANYNHLMQELESGASARSIHPNALESICASWPAKYSVPWYWCGDRRTAERFGFRLLRTWHEKATGNV